MAMDWENERYVRLFTRDTMTWKLLGFTGQTMLARLIRKLDRAGVAELHEHSTPEGLAVFLDVPPEFTELAMDGIAKLIARGVIELRDGYCFMPNFLAAQEASQSEAQRQRESRSKRHDLARAGTLGVTNRDSDVTKRDGSVTNRDEPPGGPDENVTPDQTRPASPSRPPRPSLGEQRESSLKPPSVSPSQSPAPGGWVPPAGGRTVTAIGERLAAGDLTQHQCEKSIAKFFDDAAAKGRKLLSGAQLDAAVAKWIRAERAEGASKPRRWVMNAREGKSRVPSDIEVPALGWATPDDDDATRWWICEGRQVDETQPRADHENSAVLETTIAGRRVIFIHCYEDETDEVRREATAWCVDRGLPAREWRP